MSTNWVMRIRNIDNNEVSSEHPLPTRLYDGDSRPLGTTTNPVAVQPPLSGALPVSAASLPLPTGAATSAYQATLETLVDTLQELVQRLAPLAACIQHGAASVRVNAPAGVSVSGPLTNAQYVATQVQGGINYTQKIANENMTATVANINNCTGA